MLELKVKNPGSLFLVSGLIALLAACASAPTFDTAGVNAGLTPRGVSAELPAIIGEKILWGGVILATTNLKSGTRLEVLGYPLDDSNRPLRDSDPLGRFLIQHPEYLEPATYAEGRMVTVVGTVHGEVTGKVGETDYQYPIITSQQLHLWEKDRGYDRGGNVHFGIGVGIGL